MTMLASIFNEIQAWIKGWDSLTFALTIIILVLFLGLSTVAFIKKAVSDKPAIKIGKILVIALLVFLLVYIISVH